MLTPTRFEERALNELPEPQEGLVGGGRATISQSFWDDPSGKYSVLLEETVRYFDWRGKELGKIAETREYFPPAVNEFGHVIAPPILKEKIKETWGLVFLPGFCQRNTPVLVKRETTTYFWAGDLVGSEGDVSYTRIVEGWCIRAQSASGYTYSEVSPAFESQGRKPFSGTTKDIFDTTKPVLDAALEGEIVEEPDFPQKAVWVSPIEAEFVSVEKDLVRKVRTRIHINYLRPGPPDVERDEELLPPREWHLQWPVTPPDVEARDVGNGLRIITVRGGGVELPTGETLQPDRYVLYRRAKPVLATSSALGLGQSRGDAVGTVTDAKDIDGQTVTPIPGPFVGDLEVETPPPPGDQGWSRISEARLRRPTRGILKNPIVQFADRQNVSPPVEYAAVAVVGTSFSELSRPAKIQQTSSAIERGGFSVIATENGVEVFAELPPSPDTPADDPLVGFPGGEEITEDLPLDFSMLEEFSNAYSEGNLDDLFSEFGIEVGPLADGEASGIAGADNVNDFLGALRSVPGIDDSKLGGNSVVDAQLAGYALGVSLTPSQILALRSLAYGILVRQALRDAGQITGTLTVSPLAIGIVPGQLLKIGPIDWKLFGGNYQLTVRLSGGFFCKRFEVSADGSGFSDVKLEVEEIRAP